MAERAFHVNKGGDDGGRGIDSPDGVASRRIVGASASVVFHHHKMLKMASSNGGSQ